MKDFDPERIALSWIRMCRAENGSEAYERESWSFGTVWELCREHPESAWQVIVAIYGQRPEEIILANLAAGPVEDLLVYHGSEVLPWLARFCKDEPGFVGVLQMVWRNAMTDAVWNGLKRLTGTHS